MFHRIPMMAMACAGALLLTITTQLPGASAAHLKVHTHRHDPAAHQTKRLYGQDMVVQKYLVDNYGSTYAVCVVRKEEENYSVAFFDAKGQTLRDGKFCGRPMGVDFGDVLNQAKNPTEWTEERVDNRSICYLFETEDKDADFLIAQTGC